MADPNRAVDVNTNDARAVAYCTILTSVIEH